MDHQQVCSDSARENRHVTARVSGLPHAVDEDKQRPSDENVDTDQTRTVRLPESDNQQVHVRLAAREHRH